MILHSPISLVGHHQFYWYYANFVAAPPQVHCKRCWPRYRLSSQSDMLPTCYYQLPLHYFGVWLVLEYRAGQAGLYNYHFVHDGLIGYSIDSLDGLGVALGVARHCVSLDQ